MITLQRPQGVPIHAHLASYAASNGKKGVYYWWYAGGKQGWLWHALGNTDYAPSQEAARDAAKMWIKDSRQVVPAQKIENDNTL